MSEFSISLLKPATADAEKDHGAEKAVDGIDDNSSYWSASNYASLEVDLQGFYEITRINVRNFVDEKHHYKYNVESSQDKKNWSEITSKSTEDVAVDKGDDHDLSQNPVIARYLKLNVTFNSDGSGSQVSRFKVCGSFSDNTVVKNAEDLLGRLLKDHKDKLNKFKLEYIPPDEGNDVFQIKGDNEGKIVISGNKPLCIANGLNYYLKYYTHSNISESGINLNLDTLPSPENELCKVSP